MKMEAAGAKTIMRSPSSSQIDRTSSIENEPRTLHINQMEYAREAALYVLNTSSLDDALRIFTEGLKPVRMAEDLNLRCEEVEVEDYSFHRLHARNASTGFKEIATAPF